MLSEEWYSTGDAGRLDSEGYLYLVDRVKDMIVTGGENVYSAEVENVLGKHPAVAQVAVIGIPSEEWVEAVHAAGAEVMFTVASSIPSNKLPAQDLDVYERVVEHIVRHYSAGWADEPSKPVRIYEFGDQPDFGPLHFAGRPEEFYAMYRAFCTAARPLP